MDLLEAAKHNDLRAVLELCKHNNIHIDQTDKHDNTALQIVCAGSSTYDENNQNTLPIAKKLIECGANVNSRNRYQMFALVYATISQNEDLVQLLCDHGADVNLYTRFGNTALHHAARLGLTKSISLLIDKGANINATTNDGYTPLLNAVIKEHYDVVVYLCENGADIEDAIVKKALNRSPRIEGYLKQVTEQRANNAKLFHTFINMLCNVRLQRKRKILTNKA